MKLTVLGSGTSVPRPGRGAAGLLLTEEAASLLLDAGPGTLARMADQGVLLEDLDRILVSHLHVDHTADIVAALFALKVPDLRRPCPLRLHGPPGLAALLDRLTDAWGRWIEAPPCGLEVTEYAGPAVLDGWTVAARPVLHGGGAHGLRVTAPSGRILAYSGDTDECPAVVELARGADLLVLECSHPDDRKVEGHLSPTPCGRLAAEAGASALLLTHFYPGWDPESARSCVARHFGGPVLLAADGMRVDV